jgi:hypothetical protein
MGGVISSIIDAMQTKRAESEDIGVEGLEYLAADGQLNEMVSRFRPLSEHSAELRTMYIQLAQNCNDLIKCYMNPQENKTKGALQFKANRLAFSAKNSAIKLCKQAFARYKDARSHELLREIDNLEGLCNNHLHNLMIG